MDVGEWLRSLGLGQYEANFRDNKIDADLLPRLTDAGLKDIGIYALGDRLRLLDAIAALVAAAPIIPRRTPKAAPPTSPELTAERRPITLMFCDLVGSTGLAARLDAEDWRNLVNAYLDAAEAAVTAFGGHVLKRLGDGLMALFGYPQAQENDAERAVRAALAVQRALSEINARSAGKGAPELLARIGLESGQVVVDAAGEVFGEAPNVAARVQASAEPGAVLITASVQRQTAGLFVAEDKGAHALKGVPQPVPLYRIVRASGGSRRSRSRARSPLVGRSEELDLVLRRWERARSGQGQFIQIVGEPGIGKSRLVEEFQARLGETPHTWAEFSSSQLLQNTPLHPIAEWGRLRFGDADTPPGQRFADLENTLQLLGLDPAEHAPLIAPLVDIPLPPGRAANLSPEQLRRRQLAALIAWFLAGARSQPAALAFEDLQWFDPTSLDLMQALAERGAQAPLLILATARPEFRPPWSLRSHHSVISLSPLDRADVVHMVGELAARHALSKEVVEGVSQRTGGVPLFVEEVTRLLLERGEAGGLQAIPPTLQQSLAARLDRLGEAREVAQIGAVLGRDFIYSLLRAVGEVDNSALQSALDRLADADLLIAEGAGPHAIYRFKHALIQDAAYDSMLKSRRQALHRRAAEILCDQPERVAAEPEVIAHHFTQAGLDDQAIEYWGKAGDQALRRSAFQEAIAHLGKAIEMADRAAGAGAPSAAAATASSVQRLKLQTSLGQAVMLSRGLGAEETKAVFARAQELAAGSEDAAERFVRHYGRWGVSLMRGDLALARATAETFLQEARREGGVPDLVAAGRMAGLACLQQGDFLEARSHFEEVLGIYDREWDGEAKYRHGMDSGICATAYLAHVMWYAGEVERARDLIEEAMGRAVNSGHIPTLANTYLFKSLLETIRDDAEPTLRDAEALVEIAGKHGLALYLATGSLVRGWARARLGDREAGGAELRNALAKWREQGNRSTVPLFEALLAGLDGEGESPAEAVTRIDGALSVAQQTGEHSTDAFLHRIRGDILLRADLGNPARAEEAYLVAIAIAREQGARSFGLQAALKLAKLYQTTGRPAEAHAVLAPALEGFTPTSEMPEIAEAQALIERLA